jgi:DNA-binding HxlR family transcriptional regulator
MAKSGGFVLRRLEADGLVARKVYAVVPPKTEHSLIPAGKRLHEPVAMLCSWAATNKALLDRIFANLPA